MGAGGLGEGVEGWGPGRLDNLSVPSEGSRTVSSPHSFGTGSTAAQSPPFCPGVSQSSSCESLAAAAEVLAGVGRERGVEAAPEGGGTARRVPTLPILDLPQGNDGGSPIPDSATAAGGSTSKRKLPSALVRFGTLKGAFGSADPVRYGGGAGKC